MLSLNINVRDTMFKDSTGQGVGISIISKTHERCRRNLSLGTESVGWSYNSKLVVPAASFSASFAVNVSQKHKGFLLA
jgi:hypothetical protein